MLSGYLEEQSINETIFKSKKLRGNNQIKDLIDNRKNLHSTYTNSFSQMPAIQQNLTKRIHRGAVNDHYDMNKLAITYSKNNKLRAYQKSKGADYFG